MFSVQISKGILIVGLAAPTGMAAKNISGNTIHSLLKMDVRYGGEAEFTALKDADLMELRKLFLGGDDDIRTIGNRKPLLIVDEISMVSNVMLTKIHLRCCEITGKNDERTYLYYL